MGYYEKCEKCGEACKILNTEIKKKYRKDGVEYQRYWDVIFQCPECYHVQFNQLDI